MSLESVRKNRFELLDCQVDLILRSLEFYAYTYQFIYPRSRKDQTKEENLRISLVCDTYEQIMNEYGFSKVSNSVGSKILENFKKNFKKVV